MEDRSTKIYRITYRAKVGSLALVGEVNFKTKKEKWDIVVKEALKQCKGVKFTKIDPITKIQMITIL